VPSCCLIIGPATPEQYLDDQYLNLKELGILRVIVFSLTYNTMGLKSFCFSGLELLALYFVELFFSLSVLHTQSNMHTQE
jgi:hypothetical protein